jgi:large subunit ribosomal protein L15
MELSSLKTKNASKKPKRVGRGPGSGNGKTSGRGHKGQQSRAGYSRNYSFEGGQMPLHRRLPKRGFNHAKRLPMAVVNIDILVAAFEDGDTVTTADILTRGLAKELKGGIKLLGRGEATKKLSIQVQGCSPAAKEKIEAGGGSVEIVALKSDSPVEEAPAAAAAPASEPAEPAAETTDTTEAETSGDEE